MSRRFVYDTLDALTRTLLPPWPVLARADRKAVEDDVVGYVQRQVGRMPLFLRVPYVCVVAVFALGAMLRYGQAFPRLPALRRRAWINAWALSPIIPLRDFVKMIRSCGLLAWFDHPVVAAALNERGEEERN